MREHGDTVGLTVLDVHGSERVYLVTDESGGEASVGSSENTLAGVRVNDDDRVTVFVAGPDGTIERTWPERPAPTSTRRRT